MINLCSHYLPDIKNIGFNIFGGVIVIILERIYFFINKKIRFYRIKKIFGEDVGIDYKLVYGQFSLKNVFDNKGKPINYPFTKSENGTSHSIIDPVSFSDTKAAKYISLLIAKETGGYSELVSDSEFGKDSDKSYCSTGGYSNNRSIEILKSENNQFFDFNLPKDSIPGIIDKETNEITINDNPEFDLGIIIKIKNRYFPKRSQMCIAGLNIWGTSGAAWLLANKWKEVYRIVGKNEFGLIIKVKKGNDQESEIIKIKVK